MKPRISSRSGMTEKEKPRRLALCTHRAGGCVRNVCYAARRPKDEHESAGAAFSLHFHSKGSVMRVTLV